MSRWTRRFDIDQGVSEARIAAVKGRDLWPGRGHLPECAGQRGRRRDEVDGIVLSESAAAVFGARGR